MSRKAPSHSAAHDNDRLGPLRVAVIVGATPGRGFHSILQGAPEDCLRALELDVLRRVPEAADGFRIMLATGAARKLNSKLVHTDRCLTPNDLVNAHFWGDRRADVWLELGGHVDDEHGTWVHEAAAKLQRRWRLYRSWQQWTDITDVQHAFSWALSARGVKSVCPTPLFRDPASRELASVEPFILELAVAYACCIAPAEDSANDQPTYWAAEVFRWLEAQSVELCLREAEEYFSCLDGLSGLPQCLPALQQLTKSLLQRLSHAFPWFLEATMLDNALRCACQAGESLGQLQYSTKEKEQKAFAVCIHSEVLAWLLNVVEDALGDLEMRFFDAKLAARIADMACFPCLKSHLVKLRVEPHTRPRLVCVQLEGRPRLVLPTHPGEHFGRIVRTVCMFYRLDHCQLFMDGPGEPLPIEASVSSIAVRGLLLHVSVHPFEPSVCCMEFAVLEVAKSLGSKFKLQREDRVLEVPAMAAKSSKRSQLKDVMIVVLPGDFRGARQYFHVYYSRDRKLVTFHESLHEVLDRLRRESEQDFANIFDTPSEVSAKVALRYLEGCYNEVRQWISASVGLSSSNSNTPQRDMFCGGSPTLQNFQNAWLSLAPASESLGNASHDATETTSHEVACESGDPKHPPDYGQFLCPVKGAGTLLRRSTETAGEEDASDEDDSDTHDPYSSLFTSPKDSWTLSNQILTPQALATTTLAVAACSAPLLLATPLSQLMIREVTDSLSYNAALSGGPMSQIQPFINTLSGNLGTKQADSLLAEGMSFVQNGKVYSARYEHAGHSWPFLNGLLPTVLVSASIQGASNLYACSRGEMSARDVALGFLNDVKDGALVWITVKGFVTAMTIGEFRGSGLLASACSLALHYPVPVTLGMLGCTFLTVRCINYSLNRSPVNRFQSSTVLMASSSAVGVTVSLASNALGMPPIAAAVFTCAASYGAGKTAHEVWRAFQQRRAEERLRNLACELLGLPYDYTAKTLRRRWRILARLAHPDRNQQPDAKKTFTLFQLCKDVLEEALHNPERDNGRLRGLLRCVRRAFWFERSNLPPSDLLRLAN